MKEKAGLFRKLALVAVVVFSFSNKTIAQDKVNISVGFGSPEVLNAGVRFQLDQTQLGFSLGTLGNMISASGDVFYHFGGASDLSSRRSWYGRIGLNYQRDEQENFIEKFLWISPRIGRDFNISQEIGIALDAGAAFRIYHEESEKHLRRTGSIVSIFQYFPASESPCFTAFKLSLLD